MDIMRMSSSKFTAGWEAAAPQVCDAGVLTMLKWFPFLC